MFTIHKLDFSLKYDILRLEDKTSYTFFEINLNQAFKTQVSDKNKKIKICLDGDADIDVYVKNNN